MRANVVYNEYISDKMHVHMNSTQWTTLGTFVQYLGRTGKCVVDETEKVQARCGPCFHLATQVM